MIAAEMVLSLMLAVLFYVLLSLFLKQIWWPRATTWIPLLVLFLFIWAGGIWVTPFGATLGNIRWMPFVAVGLVVTILLAAATPPWWPPKTMTDKEPAPHAEKEATAERRFVNWFLWICVGLLVFAIVARYTRL